MQSLNTFRRYSLAAFALVLGVTLVVGALLVVMIAQNPVQSARAARLTNASAEQDLRMVMHELERERLDRWNAHVLVVEMRARSAAEQDLRMVMQELERERLDQLNATQFAMPTNATRTIDEASISCLDPRVSGDR